MLDKARAEFQANPIKTISAAAAGIALVLGAVYAALSVVAENIGGWFMLASVVIQAIVGTLLIAPTARLVIRADLKPASVTIAHANSAVVPLIIGVMLVFFSMLSLQVDIHKRSIDLMSGMNDNISAIVDTIAGPDSEAPADDIEDTASRRMPIFHAAMFTLFGLGLCLIADAALRSLIARRTMMQLSERVSLLEARLGAENPQQS